jgi:hypothetical protein
MHRIFAWAALAALLVLPGEASACEGDGDCPGHSRCVRSFGQLSGVCERAASSSERREPRRVGDPREPGGSVGAPCDFESDCADGLRCVRQSGTRQKSCRR